MSSPASGASPRHPAVVCIGAATHDTIAVVRGSIGPDVRLAAKDLLQAGGGPAATAAVALARLGVPVSFIGSVGGDASGRRLCDELEREGIEVSGLRVVPGGRTAASVIVVDAESGRRAIAAFAGASPAPALHARDLERCAAARWVHVDQAGYPAVAALRHAGIRTPVSLDAGNPVPGLDLAAVDLYAPTEAALRADLGGGQLEEAMRRALAAGARTVVVTRGPAGSLAAQADPGATGGVRFTAEPAPRLDRVVSTLGAGDVFHGALLAALAGGRELAGALRYANTAAALSCRALDGRSGIPTADEVEALLASGPPGA